MHIREVRHGGVVRGATLTTVLVLVLAAAGPRPAFAQVNPLTFGTWKLNLARSVYKLGPPPTGQTQVFERSGDGVKVSVETIAGRDVRIAYEYTAQLDGQENPIDGDLTPNGADTIALTIIDAFTIEATLWQARDPVLSIRIQVSADGKVLTLTSRGTNRNEQPTDSVAVFDKQ